VPQQKIQRSNYQPVILMEFVACILLTALTPVASKKNPDGLSPYAGRDIVKLGAITVLYLILAMMSTGGRGPGRLAAWFGGLILIVDGMHEASNLVKDIGVFTGGLSGGTAAAAGGVPAGTTQLNAASIFGTVEGAVGPPVPVAGEAAPQTGTP
jgi:hypothetical protein